ncbi:NIPSNAP family protein [Rhizobium cremeum]|uniref:NIPSNAP family protein n=1 Tax=Rhizobium cremeum TaxID=2813827 RepID=UPI000DE0B0DB|nr:NIPSNAP family protein [Rhizobium cremeum]MCJ7996238.1 NIPSNAP family protein [Rhizobium cremeum]MCJ8001497.1 NIPSNAP family protein [Rhizobium cremeum]
MYTTLADVRIEDLARFVAVFATAGAEIRSKHGSRAASIFAAEPGRVLVLIDWPSEAAFAAFRADPAVPDTMASGGTLAPPVFTALGRVAEFPA